MDNHENRTLPTLSSASPAASVRQRIEAIERQLEPITREQAGEAIAVMLKGYGAVAGGDDPALARLYLKAAEGLPRGAVERLCEDIALGKVEGVSDDYPPKVPKFARLLRSRAEGLRASLRNRQREASGTPLPMPGVKLAPPVQTQTVEELREEGRMVAIAEARARHGRVAADIAARKAAGSATVAELLGGESSVPLPADVEAGEG